MNLGIGYKDPALLYVFVMYILYIIPLHACTFWEKRRIKKLSVVGTNIYSEIVHILCIVFLAMELRSVNAMRDRECAF